MDDRPTIRVAPEQISVEAAHDGRIALRLDYQPEDVPKKIRKGRVLVLLSATEALEFARQLTEAAERMKP